MVFEKIKQNYNASCKKEKNLKKFFLYKRIITLITNKKRRESNMYPICSMRTLTPYFKIRWQFLKYMLQTHFPKKLDRYKIYLINKKSNKKKTKQILNFTTKLELQLGTLLLRMQLFASSKLINQFIKHGFIFVNYKQIKYSTFLVKPFDIVSCFINLFTSHRFFDPVYISHWWPGLYRENSGRQSPVNKDILSLHIKMNLNLLNKKKIILDFIRMQK